MTKTLEIKSGKYKGVYQVEITHEFEHGYLGEPARLYFFDTPLRKVSSWIDKCQIAVSLDGSLIDCEINYHSITGRQMRLTDTDKISFK